MNFKRKTGRFRPSSEASSYLPSPTKEPKVKQVIVNAANAAHVASKVQPNPYQNPYVSGRTEHYTINECKLTFLLKKTV
jgi:hypothetical protein